MEILGYIALTILFLRVVIRVSNSVRFSAGRPSKANICNYLGAWKSDSAPFVSGKILAEIPYPPPTNEAFVVKAFVYYNILNIYRMGQFVSIELEGFIQDSGTTSGSNSETPLVLPPQITFKSKCDVEGAQKIDYVSTSDSNFSSISGGYRSESPYDIGHFSLKKTQ